MIYEQRIYRALPGRLPRLLQRFEADTLPLWEKHGLRPVGFFTTLVGESSNDLTYLLAWESMAERETKWGAFQADPTGRPSAPRARRTARCWPTSPARSSRRRRSPG
jgi:hypothetical protein